MLRVEESSELGLSLIEARGQGSGCSLNWLESDRGQRSGCGLNWLESACFCVLSSDETLYT